MKIYKTNLHELIREAKPPFYISEFSSTENGAITSGHTVSMCSFQVTVAAFNESGQPCELHLCTPKFWAYDKDARSRAMHQADEWAKEIRARLSGLTFEIRNGRLSEQPVIGVLD